MKTVNYSPPCCLSCCNFSELLLYYSEITALAIVSTVRFLFFQHNLVQLAHADYNAVDYKQ